MKHPGRNSTLDGIRGCLALLVFAGHVDFGADFFPLNQGTHAVWAFFALSGCVLVPAWDGRYWAFLLRRFVRLWPVYALCISAGYVLIGMPPSPAQYVFLPVSAFAPAADTPAWSLTVEFWAMPFMPILVWVSRGSAGRAVIAVLGCLVACVTIDGIIVLGIYFVLGAWLARFKIRFALLETAIPQWLGRISYPLYLCHWPILNHVPGPLAFRVVLSVAVAQILTMTVERWSVALSRRIGRRAPQVAPATAALEIAP